MLAAEYSNVLHEGEGIGRDVDSAFASAFLLIIMSAVVVLVSDHPCFVMFVIPISFVNLTISLLWHISVHHGYSQVPFELASKTEDHIQGAFRKLPSFSCSPSVQPSSQPMILPGFLSSSQLTNSSSQGLFLPPRRPNPALRSKCMTTLPMLFGRRS